MSPPTTSRRTSSRTSPRTRSRGTSSSSTSCRARPPGRCSSEICAERLADRLSSYPGSMPQRTDVFDLQRLGLTSGEGRRLDLHVRVEPFSFGGQTYAADPDVVPVRLDVSRTTGSGWALRLRFSVAVTGPCMRCLEAAEPRFEVDAREVEQPGAG